MDRLQLSPVWPLAREVKSPPAPFRQIVNSRSSPIFEGAFFVTACGRDAGKLHRRDIIDIDEAGESLEGAVPGGVNQHGIDWPEVTCGNFPVHDLLRERK
jgi:hypothetical protein